MEPILIDTGVLFALLDKDESRHEECVRALQGIYRPIVTCEAVISESCYLLRRKPQAIQALLTNVASGLFGIPFQISRSAPQVQALLEKYRDTPADYADTCLIAMADELGTGDILTLDSDFAHYRWRRNRRFNLLIPLE
ncbi:MAG: PIN domain-containing protein [Terracidiphilus sp.]